MSEGTPAPLPSPEVGNSFGKDIVSAQENFSNEVFASGFSSNPENDSNLIVGVPKMGKDFVAEETNPETEKSQLDKEFSLSEKYTGSSMAPVLENDLNILKRFAGIGMPQFKFKGSLDGLIDPIDSELTQDIGGGLVEFGMTHGPHDWVRMQIRPQLDEAELPSQDEYDGMNSVDQYNIDKGRYGEIIAVDELPEASKVLIGDLLELTDAELVREDNDGDLKVFKGSYQGTVIYFEQTAQAGMIAGNKDIKTHSVAILGESMGEASAEQFSSADYGKIRKAGIEDVRTLFRAGVNHSNLDDYLRGAEEIQRLGDEIQDIGHLDFEITRGFEAKDDMDALFAESGIHVEVNGVDKTSELSGHTTDVMLQALESAKRKRAFYARRGRVGKAILRGIDKLK